MTVSSAATQIQAVTPVHPKLLALAVLAAGILLTLAGWVITKDEVERLARGRFDARAAELHTVLEQRMAAYPQVLRALQAMVAATGHPSRADWERANQTLQVERTYPGLTGTVYIRSVPGAERERFLAQTQAFEPGFQIKPPGERDYYTVVTSVEPRTPANLPVIGSDSWTNPVRRATLEAARDSGAIQITGKVTLVTDDKPTPAFLMYQAIYAGTAIPATIEERRAKLLGFATAGCRVEIMTRTILPADLTDVAVRVHDGTIPDGDSLYYASHPDFDFVGAKYQSTAAIEIGGRTWTVAYAALPGFTQAAESALPHYILGSGLLVSLLVTMVVWSQATTRARASALARDMTRTLRANEARFRELAENIDQVFFVADPQYRQFEYVSPSFTRIWGRPREALLADPTLWRHWLHPEDRDQVLATVAAHGADEEYSSIFRIIRDDGTIRWLAAHAFNVPPADGEPPRVVGFHSDITAQKEAEARIAGYIAAVEASNNELEQFAYVASHDLREPLRMVSSYLSLIERRYGERLDEDGREFIGYAREGAIRLDRLILELLEFSRIQRSGRQLAAVGLAEVMGDALGNLALAIGESGARIDYDPASLPQVEGDREQLASLLQNLMGNALKYRAPDRAPEVAITAARDAEADLWRVAVSDNGIGIEAEHYDRIFRIFQRLHTREQYEGTGIGLAVCKKIVERHGGTIWVESSPGQGSTFFFTLRPA